MLSDELADFTARHQVYLERFKEGEIRRTDPLFVSLIAELTKLLFRLRISTFSELGFAASSKLLLDIENIHTEAYKRKLDQLAASLKDLATSEREFELEAIDQVTIDEVEPDDGDAKQELWAGVMAQPMSSSGKLLAAYLGVWMGLEVTRAVDLARKMIAEGRSPNDLLIAFRGTSAQGFSDGLFASARRNTARTIRTAIQHVSTTARWSTMRDVILRPKGSPRSRRPSGGDAANAEDAIQVNDAGVVTRIPKATLDAAKRAGIKVGDNVAMMGYRWVAILDSNTTTICRSLDGQVFQFGKGPIPPAHEGCRSTIMAEIRGKWRKRDATGRFAKDDRVRPAPGGDVPARTTYYEWLKTQPKEFQNDALGVTRAELFRKGGLSAAAFARLNLDRNFDPLTLDEMRKRAPRVFKRAGK